MSQPMTPLSCTYATRPPARSTSSEAPPRPGCTTVRWRRTWFAPAGEPPASDFPRPERQLMSSHREAPEISKDPVADSTDLYAFVSPDKPDTVTLIANYLPLEGPAGGPNFYEFGDDVLYEIHVDTHGHSEADITYEFRFHTQLPDPDTFLYNTGPITSLNSPNWNRRQTYSVTRVDDRGRHRLGADLAC